MLTENCSGGGGDDNSKSIRAHIKQYKPYENDSTNWAKTVKLSLHINNLK